MFRSDWHSNRFVQGSCSYHSMRSNRHDRKELKASFAPDGVHAFVFHFRIKNSVRFEVERILFAREATHERYYGTTNAAKKIINL